MYGLADSLEDMASAFRAMACISLQQEEQKHSIYLEGSDGNIQEQTVNMDPLKNLEKNSAWLARRSEGAGRGHSK